MIRDGRLRYHEALKDLLVPIDSVTPAPFNYNNGDVEQIALSIETNGMYRPVFSQQATDVIIVGNHTWLACKSLDATQIPLVPLDVDDIEAKKIMVADNRTASLARPDDGLLMELLQQINDGDPSGLLGTGYTADDLKVLEALNEIPLDTEEYKSWPNFSVLIPPHVLRGFMWMTREADTPRDRFELLLRLAGWDGESE